MIIFIIIIEIPFHYFLINNGRSYNLPVFQLPFLPRLGSSNTDNVPSGNVNFSRQSYQE